jgi:hypothetical protein
MMIRVDGQFGIKEKGMEKSKRRENCSPLYKEIPSFTSNTLNPDDLMPCTLKHDQLFYIRN